MKLGIFGGSFDPIHTGHLILADFAREAANLDQVWFVPTATSPLKPDGPVAKDRQRSEMTQLAIGGNNHFLMSKIELDRQTDPESPSYTVDTLTAISKERPEDELFLILGGDSLEAFAKWKEPEQICKLAVPLVGSRRGSDVQLESLSQFVDGKRLEEIKSFAFEFPWIEISSTEIRQRVGTEKSIRYRTPRSVECYIQNAKLYQ